jgi:hypothetical protein
LLFKSQTLCDRIKQSVPSDYSCQCQYCSSPQRRRYFAQFIQPD